MKNKPLLLLSGVFFFSHALFAQNQKQPVPAPSFSDLEHESSFGNQSEKRTVNHQALKPTIVKQRLIATSIRNDSTGSASLNLSDSALFSYTDPRGSYASATKGVVTMVSNYDTSYAYTIDNQFLVPVPRASRKYDSDNRLIHDYNYDETATLTGEDWYEYYTTDTTQKHGYLNHFNSQDYGYKESQYSSTGKMTIDTFSQVVPSMPNSAYNWDYNSIYQYDAQDRPASYVRTTNAYCTNGYHAQNTIWHIYDNNSQTKPTRDSSVFVMTPNVGNVSTSIATTEYTYDASFNVLQMIQYNEPAHVPSYRATYTYDGSGNQLSFLYEMYSNGQWNNQNKSVNQYANDVITLYAYYQWSGSAWTETTKTVYSLYSDLLADSMSEYNSGILNNIVTYSYNDFGNIDQATAFIYNADTIKGRVITHNYYDVYDDGTQPSAINNVSKNNLNAVIYPNPVCDMIYISIPSFKESATVVISNLSGSVIDNIQMHVSKESVDFSGYPKGIYFIKITSKQGVAIKKVVKS